MKNKTDIIIIIFIFSLIFVINFITSKNTERVVKSLKESNDIQKIWEEEYPKLALYIEHDELEKIGKIIADYSNEDKNEFIFLLNHIEEKGKLNLKNIF